ncbi:uncharacterized protein RJT21DRAFT_122762 [Scheffersomyces amazonensis]|uniref:uncharacterized protein n=1 Tax=Scheffersomyces amazonensis TaxID=1078765 RepID=UPI00315C8AA3
MSFVGRKALVTGASRGLGKAISHKLASQGCSVLLVSRNEDLLRQQVKDLPQLSTSQKHDFVSLDLNDLIISPDKKKHLSSYLGDVSILVNCAGVTNHSLLYRLEDSEIISTINLNLIAPILLSKLLYKPMLKLSKESINKSQPISQILNISSILSLTETNVPGTSVYSASKAGILGFTKSLSAEFKGKVRVNSILPGLIRDTDMGAGASSSLSDKSISLDHVVSKSMDILLDDSVNGQCIICDNEPTKKFEFTS